MRSRKKSDEFGNEENGHVVTAGNTEDSKSNENEKDGESLLYAIEDVPPWYLTIFLGLQQYMTMFGSTVTLPFIIAGLICAEKDELALGMLISTIFFVSGLVTLMQSTFGIRLPIIQGGTFSFLAPAIAILKSPQWDCKQVIEEELNVTANLTDEFYQEVWQSRMREIQGAIIMSSMLQVFIGLTGVLGLVIKLVTPITIAPTIGLIGFSLFKAANNNASQYWPISISTIVLLAVFSQYCRNISVPCCSISRVDDSKFGLKVKSSRPMQVFKLFPILMAIAALWIICAILTATVDLPEAAQTIRTDLKMNGFKKAAWFRIPYPFQWGLPTFSVASVVGMLAGVLASMVESIGDYYAAARFSGAKPPPTSAINRGILIEGIGCTMSGIWGTGTGTTSYSENIGAIGITKVGSRRVIQVAAIIAIVFGVVGKIGALFATIPTPIIGGVFYVMFGLIGAVGISNLQLVDLNSSRNLFIVGLSFFCGLAIPDWMSENENIIDTGSVAANQIITVLLSTSMFVGGAIAMFLDNTVPGSLEERGLIDVENNSEVTSDHQELLAKTYDFPCGMAVVRKLSWLRFCPVSPTWVYETKETKINDTVLQECAAVQERREKGEAEATDKSH